MNITSKLREEPYNYTADIEYYQKGYRSLIGVPGRVIQAKELSALSMYPIYAMNDIAATIFSEGIISGLSYSNDTKISMGSVSGITMELEDILEKVNIVEADIETEEIQEEASYTNEELVLSGIMANYLGIDLSNSEPSESDEFEENQGNIDAYSENIEEEEPYTVTKYENSGEESWPKNII